ncbi:MAG: type IV toxin-antitoxin system AbiEi family antitoxin [Edaphobacter sp.]
MVGSEGFEGSYTRDRYAVFFVEFDCKTTQFEGFARILKRTLPSRIFSPMDSFSQDFRITSYHLIAPKIVQLGINSRSGENLPSVLKDSLKRFCSFFILVRESRTVVNFVHREHSMDRRHTDREETILGEAFAALHRTVGLEAQIIERCDPHVAGDAMIEVKTATKKYQFLAEVKTVRHFATIGLVKEQLEHLDRGVYPLLVAPYITRALAEHCRTLHLPFIDTAGNAYLDVPGLTVYVTGEPRPEDAGHNPRYRAYTTVGMKVVFALLCRPELAEATRRNLAEAAQVALGTVGPVIDDLENRGYIVQRDKKVLTNTKKLMEEWVARFPDALRPKLFKNRYQADMDRLLTLDLHAQQAFWGTEVAAQRLTGYLKPERFTIYLRGDGKPLLNQARMRLDPKGNTELLQAFWGFPEDPAHPDLVPPLLAYADLIATQDGRNLEAAHLLYEQFLEPTHRL